MTQAIIVGIILLIMIVAVVAVLVSDWDAIDTPEPRRIEDYPMKLFASPFTLSGPALETAVLSYTMSSKIPRTVRLNIVNNADGTSTLTVPSMTTLPKAVMTLTVTPLDKNCCCRTMVVYTELCGPSLYANKHTGTDADGDNFPTCNPTT